MALQKGGPGRRKRRGPLFKIRFATILQKGSLLQNKIKTFFSSQKHSDFKKKVVTFNKCPKS